jgi:hypothetical protein
MIDLAEKITALRDAGLTRKQVAEQIGVYYGRVVRVAKEHGIEFVHASKQVSPGLREQQMAALYKSGRTLEEIGSEFGVTRERVRQIIGHWFSMSRKDGGQSISSEKRKQQFEANRNNQCLKKWGCSWEQYCEIRVLKTPTRAFARQKENAKKRGIQWDLTLWQWWCIWQQSGKLSQRGRGQGYVMCRRGDIGAYAVGNVFIATAIENSSSQARKKSSLPCGVRKNRRCAGYTAVRMINGKYHRLGSFPTPELAHAAYLSLSEH